MNELDRGSPKSKQFYRTGNQATINGSTKLSRTVNAVRGTEKFKADVQRNSDRRSGRSPGNTRHNEKHYQSQLKFRRERNKESKKNEEVIPLTDHKPEDTDEEWIGRAWMTSVVVFVVLAFIGVGIGLALHFTAGSGAASSSSDIELASTEAPSVGESSTPSPYNDTFWNAVRGECGLPKIQPELITSRIIKGTEAKRHSWPWQISLLQYNDNGDGPPTVRHICGGTLVSYNSVITAAHCFLINQRTIVTTNPSKFRVIVGGHDKSQITGGARLTEISKIVHHPDNNLALFSKLKEAPVNDITILKLETSFDPSQQRPVVTFACLPKPKVVPPIGKRCWATGWGKTYNTGYETVLKQTSLSIISKPICTRFFQNMIDYKKHLCVYEKTTATCQGDSGGPLVCQGPDNKWTLYGATSFGPNPCATGPGVFAAVAFYMEWICCVLKDIGPCTEIKCASN
ncbi:chymotrypsinogen B-like isoform X1 [Clavelina lepadiformis]|uniref:chymotrypsinogen B-like isoform X1 n=1 Tax=Clavelina lepadiformis TaxID=159417 RepID=UPI004042B13E